MKILDMEIDHCGDCPYCVLEEDLVGIFYTYRCEALETAPTILDPTEILPECPLPDKVDRFKPMPSGKDANDS